MSSPNDVIVFDEEYKSASKQISTYGEALIIYIETFNNCIKTIDEIAIKDKEISEKLSNLVLKIEELKPSLEDIIERGKQLCKEYINEIDAADQFLY